MYPSYVALSDFFVIYLQNPVESPTVRHVKTTENIEVALPERFKLRSRNNRHMAGISLDLLIFYWEIHLKWVIYSEYLCFCGSLS